VCMQVSCVRLCSCFFCVLFCVYADFLCMFVGVVCVYGGLFCVFIGLFCVGRVLFSLHVTHHSFIGLRMWRVKRAASSHILIHCIHEHMYIYACTSSTSICVYIYIYIRTRHCFSMCVCAYINICIYICVHIYVRTYTHTYRRAAASVCVYLVLFCRYVSFFWVYTGLFYMTHSWVSAGAELDAPLRQYVESVGEHLGARIPAAPKPLTLTPTPPPGGGGVGGGTSTVSTPRSVKGEMGEGGGRDKSKDEMFTGWCSWYELMDKVSEKDLVSNADSLKRLASEEGV